MLAEVGPITACRTEDDDWRWYSVEQAAALLGISTPTVRRRIRDGGPPFTLRDGSTAPVIAEQLQRPQGTYFQVKLPPDLVADSTEDPDDASVTGHRPEGIWGLTAPDGSPPPVTDACVTPDGVGTERTEPDSVLPVRQASGDDDAAVVTGGDATHHASGTVHDVSDLVPGRVVAQLVEQGEMIGELRAKLARSEADLDASRRETARVEAELARVTAEAAEQTAERERAVRHAEDGRLVAEAALLALEARLAPSPSAPPEPPSTRRWWRWLFTPW